VPPQRAKSPPGPASIPTGQRRPTLIVDEDYDLIFDDESEYEGIEPSIEPGSLVVSATAQRSFTTRHEVMPDVAIAEILVVAAEAVAHGKTTRREDGRIVLEVEQFILYLSPNGKTVIGYRTRHYERTPTQVFSGVPSRFGAGKGRNRDRSHPQVEIGPPKSLLQLQEGIDPEAVRFSSLATHQLAKQLFLHKSDPELPRLMRAALTQALAGGSWTVERSDELGPRSYGLFFEGRKWILDARDSSVILCVPNGDAD